MPSPAEVCIGDLGVTYSERQERMAGLIGWFASLGPQAIEHLRISDQGARGDGGALVYVFDTPDGQLSYQDTSGYWTGLASGLHPDVAIIAAAGRGNIDGEPIQGSLAQFVARAGIAVAPEASDPVAPRRLAPRILHPHRHRAHPRGTSPLRSLGNPRRAHLPKRPPLFATR